ncbi:related to protein involved in intramitochondrial protein sorting [Melanopsichium pennsylvanicum]|uniref:Related to protein involved in intramitochondrial protein sorting n=2 Tax=Melanopsichium pennsylvanicum TaxID=63383 RepID=A0AAJ4XJ07_9BASI|nr:related to protein involved in intramitochondrial protein sorting [Melanopsichium pennsylvanicum 4]SNX82851.1 related to protein involved in intramitochondrial protein sorting [Melanopsichium pennsylvanicum]
MPKTFTQTQEFAHPWHQTANAVWNKYPNPHADHVVSVDTLSFTFDPTTATLRTERIIGVRQGAPGWLMRLTGASEDTYVREVVMINPFSKQFRMSSTNLSLTQYMLVKEYITYTPRSSEQDQIKKFHNSNPTAENTVFSQTADISCTGFTGILSSAARKVEEWSHSRFGDNAGKGRAGLQSVLDAMYSTANP